MDIPEVKGPLEDASRFDTLATAAHTLEAVAGASLVITAIDGIDAHEATSETQALGSITFGNYETFVIPSDIGFGALAVVGLALFAHGIKNLHGSR